MMRISEFKGHSTNNKKELIKEYIKTDWINIGFSYFFIIISSSSPILSSMNGAIYVLMWYTLAIILAIYAYVSQTDYMSKKRIAEKYSRKHKKLDVERGYIWLPEIGGSTFVGMQLLAACVVFIVYLPIVFYFLTFRNFEMYLENYSSLFFGIFADTYMVAFLNIIFLSFKYFLLEYEKDRTLLKKTIFTLTLKQIIKYAITIIILIIALIYYFNNEFVGLFGNTTTKIVGSIYIIYILWPLIKCIIEILRNDK